jgi:hypothetical protein
MFQYGQLSNALFRVEHQHSDGSWGEMEPQDPHDPEDPERGWQKGHIYICRACNETVRISAELPEGEAASG